METYGYIRVSSADQSVDRQLNVMKERGVREKNLYMDKKSGKDFERPQYKKMIRKLKPGDLLLVVSIDRLGRNYEDVQEQWRIITKERKADICVIDMPLLDTRTGKDLLGTFISDLILQVLSFVAENERHQIKERQRQGIEAARKRGVHLGRPEKKMPEDFDELVTAWEHKQLTTKEVCSICSISETTFRRKKKMTKKCTFWSC